MLEPIIISLGSNIGNRIGFIYKALALIEEHPITIRELSNVYETPSWGFDSTHFYNACAILKTSLGSDFNKRFAPCEHLPTLPPALILGPKT